MITGQWMGVYKGTNSGKIILNLDRRPGGFSGIAAAIDDDPKLPHATYFVTLRPDNAGFKGHADLQSYFRIQNNRWTPVATGDVVQYFPMLQAQATHIDLDASYRENDRSLWLRFHSNAQTFGTVTVVQGDPVGQVTEIESKDISWGQFREMLADVQHGLVYRGQPRRWPLRTSFHRAGRFDVARFASEDMLRLGEAITAVTDIRFDLADARTTGALLGIAQHHGYPTPLLDWTESPYVAAYFACREAVAQQDAEPTVFVFNRLAWAAHHNAVQDIGDPIPSIGFIKPLPLKNPRLISQQSILMFCSVDNFERFVKRSEEKYGVKYLSAFRILDNPSLVLKDLRMMGVYSASLFPGLDGMCRGVFEESIEA